LPRSKSSEGDETRVNEKLQLAQEQGTARARLKSLLKKLLRPSVLKGHGFSRATKLNKHDGFSR
jgi:hypothetical protein